MKRVLNYLTLFRRERRPGDLVFAIGFFIFAMICAMSLPWQAKFLGNKAFVSEPGFWPMIGVLMMAGFGAAHLLGTWNAPRLPGRYQEVMHWVRSIEFVGWFIAYVIAVPVIGYLAATMALAFLLTFRLGYRSASVLGAALLFAVVVVLIFKAGLGVKIPAGAVYQYLPESIRTFFMVNF